MIETIHKLFGEKNQSSHLYTLVRSYKFNIIVNNNLVLSADLMLENLYMYVVI